MVPAVHPHETERPMTVADLRRRDEADALVRDAHLNVHRYPPDFPGFRARVRLGVDHAVAVGRALFPPDAAPEVQIAADPGDAAWLSREAASMVGHRLHRSYEEGDGRFAKDVGAEGGPFGEVVHIDDPMLSTYWIENGHITRIGRTVDGGRLTIAVQDQAPAPDGRWVARSFTVLLQDEGTGRIVSAEAYHDRYVDRDGLLLPARRRVVSLTPDGSRVRELVLDHHALLDAPEGRAA